MPESLVTRLIAEGQLGQALSRLSMSRPPLTIPERVLRLELTSVTSAKHSCAAECSELLTRRDLATEDRVRCLVVAAVDQLRAGSDNAGRATFKRAVAQLKPAQSQQRMSEIGSSNNLNCWRAAIKR